MDADTRANICWKISLSLGRGIISWLTGFWKQCSFPGNSVGSFILYTQGKRRGKVGKLRDKYPVDHVVPCWVSWPFSVEKDKMFLGILSFRVKNLTAWLGSLCPAMGTVTSIFARECFIDTQSIMLQFRVNSGLASHWSLHSKSLSSFLQVKRRPLSLVAEAWGRCWEKLCAN